MEYTDKRNDQENTVSLGILGRSYECVFCKRGFTTAQALGGHMNIHRRERGKYRPSSNKQHEGPRFYQPTTNVSPQYQTFPASASSPRSKEYNNWSCEGLSLECSVNPFEVDWRMTTSLSLQFGGSEDLMVEKKRRGGTEDMLDLELRLGYQPR